MADRLGLSDVKRLETRNGREFAGDGRVTGCACECGSEIGFQVCVFLYLLTRRMRLEGPWQRLAAALADSSAFLTPLHDQKPIPNHSGSYWGILISYPLIRLTKEKKT